MNNKINLGNRLNDAIRKKGIGKADLAEKSGYSKGYIFKIIRNEREMTMEFAQKVAPYLGVTVDYLIGKSSVPYDMRNITDDMKIWNRQRYLFSPLEEILRAFGIVITWFISIGNMTYELDCKWVCNGQEFNDDEIIELIKQKRNLPITYGVIICAGDGEEIYMNHEEFIEWERDLINELGDSVRHKVSGLNHPILTRTITDNICRAINNTEPIRWMDK